VAVIVVVHFSHGCEKMRQLVKINKINKLIKHPNADRLQIASVGLWEVITSVGQFEELDDALYCEIDSLLPLDDPRFAFLIGRNQYNIDGKEYSRLKTMRLRKALSQGLLLPIKEFQKEVDEFLSPDNTRSLQEIIGIIKYDPPEYTPNGPNASRSGPGKPFPYFVPKTDQERIQNITEEYKDAALSEELFEITYKLDGSSITMYVKDNTLGVCSRNFEFNIPFDYTEWPNIENHFIKAALDEGVLFKLILAHSRFKHNFALQGELVGPGIQSNFEGLNKHEIYIYDVYDIDNKRYMTPHGRRALLEDLDIKQVPVFKYGALDKDIHKTLEMADGPSGLNGKFREGLVFKSLFRDFSFKAISNSYLLSEK